MLLILIDNIQYTLLIFSFSYTYADVRAKVLACTRIFIWLKFYLKISFQIIKLSSGVQIPCILNSPRKWGHFEFGKNNLEKSNSNQRRIFATICLYSDIEHIIWHKTYFVIEKFKALSTALVEKTQLVNLSENSVASSSPIQMSEVEFSALY